MESINKYELIDFLQNCKITYQNLLFNKLDKNKKQYNAKIEFIDSLLNVIKTNYLTRSKIYKNHYYKQD